MGNANEGTPNYTKMTPQKHCNHPPLYYWARLLVLTTPKINFVLLDATVPAIARGGGCL